jgi:hypothetical protein
MVEMMMKPNRNLQTAGPRRQRAMSIARFSEEYAIGRTTAYEELKSGRLRGRKIGTRTIISQDDAEAWLRQLPALQVTKRRQQPVTPVKSEEA